ncbi:acetyltransferase [Lachnoclostridium sp.]|uniref:acetyltransferase n=1 Tax=Lachnoclostridium sp. TaxID=2028282 RepID=UPI0028A25CFB|nr:acetyltransferase [Lachnoclostridium sp.]
MKKIVIVGVGGFGREVAWLIERINNIKPTWEIIGFVDDNISLHGKIVGGYKVIGDTDWLNVQGEQVYAVCAIGAAKTRKKVIQKLDNVKFATLIDPKVELSNRVQIGEGTIICAGSILTVDISIGSHVIINLGCTIGHDAIINDFVTLYPSVNVSGNTLFQECVEIGTGTQIIQGIKIGEEVIVGAGAVIVKDIIETGTYVGIPARKIN